jgi:hypothetical protein
VRSAFLPRALLSILALSAVLFPLIPITSASAAQVVTCVNLNSGKERISKTGTCRTTQEATAKWRLAQPDSALTSGATTKALTICTNKESSPVTYQVIRTSCYKHMKTNLYTRLSSLPAKPVITKVSATSYESASLSLADDSAANLDAPIAYYTVTSSKGDVKKINSWRDLNVTVSGLRSATEYTFTITATNVDGTSPVSASSLLVTTQIYVAPVAATTTAPAPTYTVGQTGPGGGTVFYVATSPFACGPSRAARCTYLEAAPSGWNAGGSESVRKWAESTPTKYDTATVNNVGSPETATATGIGWGYRNTRAIILQGNSDTATTAAAIADYYSVTIAGSVIDDWYLPSKEELNQMCKWASGNAWISDATLCTGGTVNTGPGAAGFTDMYYWSSTEAGASSAWAQYLSTGTQNANGKQNPDYLRPIRAF